MEGSFIPAEEARKRTSRNIQKSREQLEEEDSNWIKLDLALATVNGDGYEIEYRFRHVQHAQKTIDELMKSGYRVEVLELDGQNPRRVRIHWD